MSSRGVFVEETRDFSLLKRSTLFCWSYWSSKEVWNRSV